MRRSSRSKAHSRYQVAIRRRRLLHQQSLREPRRPRRLLCLFSSAIARHRIPGRDPRESARAPGDQAVAVANGAIQRDIQLHRERHRPAQASAGNADEAIDISLCLQDGDFLLTRANTPELVGDTCIVSSAPPKTIFSDLIYRLDLAKWKLIPEYLNLYLQADAGRIQIKRDARGSSQSMVKISHDHIKNWFIPLPGLEEQRDIIRNVESRLEKLDCQIADANSMITLLNERRSASPGVVGSYRVSRVSACHFGRSADLAGTIFLRSGCADTLR